MPLINFFRRFRKRFVALLALLVLVVGVGQSCGGSDLVKPDRITLEIWRVGEGEDTFGRAMAEYSAVYGHVNFIYRTIGAESYEDELLTAWSKGEGPDIFSVPNGRLGKFREFISPMPRSAEFVRAYTEKSFGKTQVILEPRSVTFPNHQQILDTYPQAVADDIVVGGDVYGLPLATDSLVMFYNRDLLARAQVAVPPTTWGEFVDAVKAMVVYDDERNVLLPAAALGTADNIPYFMDLVSLIMMQNGTTMLSGDRVSFASESETGFPGVESVDFYRKFSDNEFSTYTWDDEQLNALEAFTQGTLGFYFGYQSDIAEIDRRAPGLNYSFSKMPQIDIDNPINYLSYNVETVHIGSENAEHAWNFLRFISSEDQVGTYLDISGRVPALRTLIGEAQQDSRLGIFSQQALTARSWYHGTDPDAATEAFRDMINEANEQEVPLAEILFLAQRKVALTL